MKKIRLWNLIGMFIFSLAVTACASPTLTPSLPMPTSLSNPQPQPTIPATPPSVMDTIRAVLALQLGIPADQITVFSSEVQEWSNSCLDLAKENENCLAAVTQGYRGTLLVGETQYEFRSDLNGENVRFIPGAALAAQQVLAAQLGILPEDVRIITAEKMDWQDGCLGISSPGQMCTEVITPGFRVILEANTVRYEYHTDVTGSLVRLALAPKTTLNQTVLTWEGQFDQGCQTLSVSQTMIVFGECEGAKVSIPLKSAERRMDLEYFLKQYAPFETQTAVGKVKFVGQGQITATLPEQRMLAEWARRLFFEAQAISPSGYSPLAFAWHREGGIAAFCDDVLVYLDGSAESSSCKSPQPQSLNRARLTASRMQQLYDWLASYQSFDIQKGDRSMADGMVIHLVFNGQGEQTAAEDVQTAISTLASEMVVQANQITDLDELTQARQALENYFKALQSKNYSEAVHLYGGDYAPLVQDNPDISASDTVALFERACTQNGFVCDITIKNLVQAAQLGEGEFRFTIEFQNRDGTLFVLEPCCGGDVSNFPPVTQFDFVVKKIDSEYKVMDLPVYVP